MSPLVNRREKRSLSEIVTANLRNAIHLYKRIKVTMPSDVFDGWLKCVDPLTGALILIVLRDINDTFGVANVNFISNSHIISIDVIDEEDPKVKEYLLKLYAKAIVSVDEDRRDQIAAFIRAHRIPVAISEDGRDICVLECKIEPPYVAQTCMGSNAMVIQSIGKVITKYDSQNKSSGEANITSKLVVNLEPRMRNLELHADEEEAKDSLSESSSDLSSESEMSRGDLQNRTSRGESSSSEDSFEFVSNDMDK